MSSSCTPSSTQFTVSKVEVIKFWIITSRSFTLAQKLKTHTHTQIGTQQQQRNGQNCTARSKHKSVPSIQRQSPAHTNTLEAGIDLGALNMLRPYETPAPDTSTAVCLGNNILTSRPVSAPIHHGHIIIHPIYTLAPLHQLAVCFGRFGPKWLPSHHPGGCCTLVLVEQIPPFHVNRFEH